MKNQIELFNIKSDHKSVEKDWDFKDADTQYLTHGAHPYPARMIPQIASSLMMMYLSRSKNPLIVDTFCGSGTVNVEASLRNFKSIGIDLNPFAVLLAKVKTTDFINPDIITDIRNEFFKNLNLYRNPFPAEIPRYKNLTHWFKEDVIYKLSFLKHNIKLIREPELKNLLLIVFSNTIMKSSNVNWGSSRYIRVYPKEKLEQLYPDVFQIFKYSLIELEHRIKLYSQKKKANVEIIRADARKLPLKDKVVDIIITSPPYGEERNTIPYIRWSKLFLLWLGIKEKEIIKTDKQALGGNKNDQIQKDDIPSDTFWKSVKDIPSQRINEAIPFLYDYLITLQEMKRILKINKRCCIIIGHRSIKRKILDMGKITKELAMNVGFKFENIFRRRIPKKMIPWSTPTGETIYDESIVILKKSK